MDADQELYLIQKLQRDEGTGPVRNGRLMPYSDSVGKLSIGFGRNLADKGISRPEANMLLANDIQEHAEALYAELPWVLGLDWPRRYVLLNMAFNMLRPGDDTRGLLSFKRTLAAIQSGQYEAAAEMMLQSKWAKQVGRRADELARIMRTGVLV